MNPSEAPTGEMIPVHDYVRDRVSLLSHLSHGWELHSALLLSPAEERTMVREPAHAVPDSMAERLGKLRVLVVPYIGCFESGDVVCFSKPSGENHTAVWVTDGDRTNLLLACREVDAHDTGFELLASIAQLVRQKQSDAELESYNRLLLQEIRDGVTGEIDKEALEAKQKLPESLEQGGELYLAYRDESLAGTLAEYLHGLWHDVQVRVGPEHLPVPQLRQRMLLISTIFPPNPGYSLFAREMEQDESK
ncbi:MAG: hypothetical protein ACRD1N_10560 [Terriglobia bacterium]